MLNYTFISSRQIYIIFYILYYHVNFLQFLFLVDIVNLKTLNLSKDVRHVTDFSILLLAFERQKTSFHLFLFIFWTKKVMVNMFRIAGLRFILAQREYDFIFLEPACHFFLYYRVHTMQQNDLLFFFFAQFAIHI